MSWLLPTPLLIVAGVLALVPLTFLLRGDGKATPSRPVSLSRLIAEAFAVTLAVIGAFWLAWAALWVVEQRW